MALVAWAQRAQDRKRLLLRRLADRDGLKAALERRVLFDIPPVLGKRRRADHAELSAPQRGLEDVRRVHRALGAARADDGVQLVKEQNDIALAPHLVKQCLHALLKLAAVLCPRDHRGEVERKQALVHQLVGHLRRRDLLCKPLRHRRLADARLADEHRVVLRAAREDLHRARDLRIAPDHRIELPHARHRRQVAGKLRESASALAALVFTQHPVSLLCRRARRFVDPPHHRGVKALRVGSRRREQPHRHVAAVAQQAQQQVLRADARTREAHRLGDRHLHRAACAGRQPL